MVDWINYHHLMYFWMVAKEGGITPAADLLHLSQPTLSPQIQKLEKSLGIKLFERKGRTMHLNGIFHRNKAIRHADIIDGTSYTIGLGERASMFSPNGWAGVIPGGQTVFSAEVAGRRGQVVGATVRPAITIATVHVRTGGPNSPTGSPGGFWGPHFGGAHFLLMDGSTRGIVTEVDIQIFRALAGRNDRVVIGQL